MWPNPQLPADLVTFTEEIRNGKFRFLCNACIYKTIPINPQTQVHSHLPSYYSRVVYLNRLDSLKPTLSSQHTPLAITKLNRVLVSPFTQSAIFPYKNPPQKCLTANLLHILYLASSWLWSQKIFTKNY